MYKLTLTESDRFAIDFIGYRYPHGDDLFKLLLSLNTEPSVPCWNDPDTLTFLIPEPTAWEIASLLQDCNYELCSTQLKYKLLTFLDQII